MKVIDFETQKANLIRKKELVKNMIEIEGSLALKPKVYEKPNITKIHILEPNKKTFMGCWQQNYQLNDGDGC